MSIAHRHPAGHPIALHRERELRILLDNPEFATAVGAYDREDDTHNIPYGGGSGTDWRTIFWDQRIAAAVAAGKFKVGTTSEDPRPAGKVHEAIEGAVIHLWPLVCKLLGWPEDVPPRYLRAHDLADIAERHAVAHKGWDWDQYQQEWLKLIEPIEKAPVTNPPLNLLLDAYQGTPLYAKLVQATQQHGAAPIADDVPPPGVAMSKPPSPASAAFAAKYAPTSPTLLPAPMAPAEQPPSPPSPVLAHGRAIAGAKALHAVGHIDEKERDKHVKASTAALAKAGAKQRKPFGSWAQ